MNRNDPGAYTKKKHTFLLFVVARNQNMRSLLMLTGKLGFPNAKESGIYKYWNFQLPPTNKI